MSESRPSQYRSLLPGPLRGGPTGPPPPRMDIPKRSMVKVACDACRHRKAKCGGRRPSCSTCISAGQDCLYVAPMQELQAAAVKRKYDELQERMVDHEKLYDTLRAHQPEEIEEILHRIQAGGDVKSVVESIQEGSKFPKLISPPTFTPQQLPAQSVLSYWDLPYGPFAGDTQTQLPVRERLISCGEPRITSQYNHPEHIFEEPWKETQYRYAEDRVFIDLPGYTFPISRWTTVSNDDKLLSHLLMLFWTWDTSRNRIIDRTILEEDLKYLDPSRLLLNFQLYIKTQATFHLPGDLNSRGKAFAIEAGHLLALEDTEPSLPVVQGLALMHIYEGALGSGVMALSYYSLMQARYLALRLDEIPHSTDVTIAGFQQRTEAHALSCIAWGYRIWDQKSMHGLCRRFTIGKPKRPKTWRDQATSPLYKRFSPGYWWFPYLVSAVPQNALKGEIFKAECDLAQIAKQILNFLTQLEEGWPPRCNTKRALELYTELSKWKYSLKKTPGGECGPAISYSAPLLITSLLRPFDGLTKNEFGPFDPVIMSYAHASNAVWIIWHFRALYTLHNEHLLSGIKTGMIQLETFAKACRALIELGESFPTATEIIYSLDSIAKKQRLELPSYINEYLTSHGGGSIDVLSTLNDSDT
ncbi:unnamed protein product [Fusarium graminearum]|nr:unnamed protein product [Fusarium graminearum]